MFRHLCKKEADPPVGESALGDPTLNGVYSCYGLCLSLSLAISLFNRAL